MMIPYDAEGRIGKLIIPYGDNSKSGPPGPPGIGFKLDANGNYDIQNKKLVRVSMPSIGSDVANKSYADSIKFDFDCKDNKLTNVKSPEKDSDASNKGYADSMKFNYNCQGNKIVNMAVPELGDEGVNLEYIWHNIKKHADSRLINVGDPKDDSDGATKRYVDSNKFDFDCKNKILLNVGQPERNTDASTKFYVDSNKFDFDCKKNKLINVAEPTNPTDASTKKYSDDYFMYRSGRSASNWDGRKGKLTNLLDPTDPADAVTLNYFNNNAPKFDFDCQGNRLINVAEPQLDSDASTKAYVDANTFHGDCQGKVIINLGNPSMADEAANLRYVWNNTVMVGQGQNYINMLDRRLVHVSDPEFDTDAATKNYVDSKIKAVLKPFPYEHSTLLQEEPVNLPEIKFEKAGRFNLELIFDGEAQITAKTKHETLAEDETHFKRFFKYFNTSVDDYLTLNVSGNGGIQVYVREDNPILPSTTTALATKNSEVIGEITRDLGPIKTLALKNAETIKMILDQQKDLVRDFESIKTLALMNAEVIKKMNEDLTEIRKALPIIYSR